jgi:alpha-tubulin suppressor-like RCC1 family protein
MNATKTPSAGRFGMVYNMAAVVWPYSERVAKLTGKMVSRTVGIVAALLMAVSPASAQNIPTTTTLSASPSPSTFGQSVTLRASVETAGKPAAAGNAAFLDGSSNLGVAALQAQGIEIARIDAGEAHTCALSTAGKVWCWGGNRDGQLGDGTTTTRLEPALVSSLSGATAISAGEFHTCALVANGEVRCWGRGDSGQLGNGGTSNSSIPVAVSSLSGATAISAGASHTCALVANGEARCWGNGSSGRLGNGGISSSSIPVAVSSLSGATAISAGAAHTCALVATGEARCWGRGADGALGNGGTSNSLIPVAVSSLSGATAISAGALQTCALVANGEARCWGGNFSGQLGNGGTSNSSIPVAVSSLSGATAISAGASHTCALVANGEARCWGDNFSGQLGKGDTSNSSIPVAVSSLSGATAISAGQSHTCALVANGEARCWGNGNSDRLGHVPVSNSSTPRAIADFSGVTQAAAGGDFTCARTTGGEVRCFGAGANGQLGNGGTTPSLLPVAVKRSSVTTLINVTKVVTGTSHACALRQNGSVVCWGRGSSGQIGDGGLGDTSFAVDANIVGTASDIATGGNTTCAVGGGIVQCWGEGSDGQLGNEAFADSATPVTVSGITTANAVAVGETFACALLNGGLVQCWGRGIEGQLGDGLGTSSALRRTVVGQDFNPLVGVTRIVAGSNHACALPADFESICWGKGDLGQLGDGNPVSSNLPVRALLPGQSLQLAAGGDTSCAFAGGQVKCWGKGTDGQLGNGAQGNSATPVDATGLNTGVASLTVGGSHACAVMTDGTMRCWGSNTLGKLGAPASAMPGPIPGFNLLNRATATLTTTALPGGTRSLSAQFAATATHGASAGTFSHTVNKQAQTINFTQPAAQTFAPGLTVALTAAATSNLTVSFATTTPAVCTVAGTSASVLAAGTCTLTANQAGNGNFNAATQVSRSFTVAKAAQTINFTQPAAQTFAPGLTVALTVSASSNLAVSLATTTPAVCTVAGTSASVLAAGTCTLTANQAGNDNFNAATQVSRSFTVAKAAQTINFTQPAAQTFAPGLTVALTVSASSNLAVSLATTTPAVCTVAGTSASVLAAGTCTLTANQAGNDNFNAATQVSRSFTVAKAAQTINFTQPAAQTFAPGLTVALTVSASSNLAVSLTTTTPAVCTVAGTSASVLAAGTCTLTANQAGNDNFNAATLVSVSFTVAKAAQTITFAQPLAQSFANGKLVALPASAASGLAVTRTSLTVAVCTISGTSARLVGPGLCSIQVSQAGDTNFNGAPPITRSFSVTAGLRPEVSALAASARLHEQGFASLAPFGSGAVMAYASRSTATGSFSILRQNLLSTGAATGLPVVVAAPAAGVGAPDVAALASGYVIVWQGPDGSSTGIFAQRFSATGAALGPVIRVNAVIVGAQSRPRVAALPGGAFAVVWQTTVSATDEDVWLRVVNAAGVPLAGDVRVNTTIVRKQNNPDIAALSTGTIAVTFASETTVGRFSVLHRLFGSTGVPLTAAAWTAGLNQALNPTPVIAARTGAGAASGFAIAYAQSEAASVATPANIHVRTLSATGVLAPAIPRANTITAGHQAAPAIAALKAGAFAVAFTTPDGSSTGIGLRLFSASAAALGSEERTNTVTALTQSTPALTPLGPAGATRGTTFLSTWTTQSAIAANGNDIAARLFQGP